MGGKFRFWTELLLREAEKHECNIVGIHGRIGNEKTSSQLSNMKARLGNLILVDNHDLLEKYGSKFDYVLLHVPEFEQESTRILAIQNSKTIRQLFIENHLAIGSFGKAIEVVRQFRFQGVNAGIMFDLFHYFNSHNRTLPIGERWKELMTQLDWLLNMVSDGTATPCGIHLPIGTNTIDSFGDDIDDAMWKELGSILAEHPKVLLVLENRQKGFNQLTVNTKNVAIQRNRNAQLLEKLSKLSIL